ncbi:MAG TPA: right-handed parallel beta-helix repeat-containing protein [Patescibacteria group bacterium]|nr:right-handed parallel beta-helix repeat-containing protein [Patescibacteria group bacterium]
MVKRIVALLMAITLLVAPGYGISFAQTSGTTKDDSNYWPGKIRLSAAGSTEGRGIFYADYLLPLYYSKDRDTLLFMNTKEDAFVPAGSESNMGAGIRHIFSDNYILGLNVFFDRKLSENDKWYSQVGTGVEFLSQPFDFRFNFYDPQTKAKALEATDSYKLGPSSLLRVYNVEEPLRGYDFEFGVPLIPKELRSRIYFGGFFFNSRYGKDVNGWKVRSETDLNKWLAIDLNFNERNAGESEFIGGVRVTVPFALGKVRDMRNPFKSSSMPNDSYIKERLFERVVRDTDIRVISNGTSPIQSVPDMDIIYVDNSNTGTKDGTLAHPWPTMAEALSDPRYVGQGGTVKYIYVFRGTGDSYVGDFDLADTTVLWGSATTGGFKGLPVTDYPVVDADSGEYVIGMSDHNTIQGLKLQHGGYGIYGKDITNATIHDNYITENGEGIRIVNTNALSTGGIEITNNTITGNTGLVSGIHIENNNNSFMSGLLIADNVITGNKGDGIYVQNTNGSVMSDVTISGNTIGGTGEGEANTGDGIYIYNDDSLLYDLEISNNDIIGNSGDGIHIENWYGGTLSNVDIKDNTVSDNTGTGVYLGNYYGGQVGNWTDGDYFNINNNEITGNNSDGIGIDNWYGATMNNVNIRDNTITGNAAEKSGIYIDNYDHSVMSEITISGNTIGGIEAGLGNSGPGIDIYNDDYSNIDQFEISSNQIIGNSGDGIHIENFNDSTISRFKIGDDNTITDNTGSGIFVGNYNDAQIGNYVIDDYFTISNNTISNNSNNGIHVENEDGADIANLNIQDNTIQGNEATGVANGIVLNNYNKADMSDVTISGNTIGGSEEGEGNNGDGIDIYNHENSSMDNFTISDNTIIGNNGDGIHIENDGTSGTSTLSRFDIKDNTISDNTGTGIYLGNYNGGQVGNNVPEDYFTIEGNTITNNSDEGIAVDNWYGADMSNLNILNNTISDNSGTGIDLDNYESSAMSDVNIIGNTIGANGEEYGGNGGDGIAIYNEDVSTLDNFAIANNDIVGNSGDGIYIDNYSFSTSTRVTIAGNTISDNIGTGIKIYNDDYSAADQYGILSNEITGNSGDGIRVENYNDSTVSRLVINDNAVSDNSGTGVYFANGTFSTLGDDFPGDYVTILNNSIINNGNDGIAFDNYGGDVAGVNIMYNGLYGNSNYDLRNDSGIDGLLAENNWWGQDSDPYINGQIGGPDSVDYDPWLFSGPGP